MADTPLDSEDLSDGAELAIEAVAGRERPDGTFELVRGGLIDVTANGEPAL